jgi:hypothetical protein
MDERTVLTHDHFKDVDEPGCVIIWETRIQWVRPLYTEVQAQAFGLVLDQAVYHGASGGGVFRYAAGQVVHIGNVWGTWEEDHRSLVALNRAEVLR